MHQQDQAIQQQPTNQATGRPVISDQLLAVARERDQLNTHIVTMLNQHTQNSAPAEAKTDVPDRQALDP